MPTAHLVRYGRALAAVLLPLLVGCAHPSQSDEAGISGEPGVFAPAIQGASDGLELQWWVARGDLHHLTDFHALTPWTPGTNPASPATPSLDSDPDGPLWTSHGLRLFTIALEDLPALENRLGIAEGASTTGLGVQRQWLGQSPTWSTFVEGPARGPIGLWTESGPLALPAGRLRLLGRAWTEPLAAASPAPTAALPALRIELAPQHVEPAPADPLGLAPPVAEEPVDEGLIFRRLALAMHVREGHALVIIPERPGVVWGRQAPPEDAAAPVEPRPEQRPAAPFAHIVRADPAAEPLDPSPPDETAAPITANAPIDLPDSPAAAASRGPLLGEPQIVAAGPRAPRLPTLGEAMLMSTRRADPDAAPRTVRAIIVLIPRLPDTYRLLPD